VLWSVGASFAPLAANAAGSYPAGSLLAMKGQSGAAVYLIGADAKKYVFPSQKEYFTWYPNFDKVVRVTVAELDMYPDGGAVTVRPGTKLVTHMNTAKVYAIEPGGILHWIPTDTIAKALYGTNWTSRLVDVIPGYFTSYKATGADVSDKYVTGTVVKMGTTYYYIDGTTKRAFASDAAFTANGLVAADAVAVTTLTGYTDGTSITGAETAIKDFTPNDTTVPVIAGNLSVSLASDTPASGVAYMNATHVAFTKVKLTAGSNPVTIDSMVVKRTGVPASDGAFTGVNILKDGAMLSSSYKALNSTHEANFTEDVVVPANGTVYLTLVGKMADVTTYAGETPTLSLTGITTLSTITGSLPIVGNAMTTNGTINIGDITISESPDLSTLTEEVGTENVEFLNVKMANDSASADIRVDSIRFNNVGSANDADVNNLELVVDGNVIATGSMVSNYVKFDLSACGTSCLIQDGKNETFTLRGDIVGGSGRTLDFDVKRADDIMAYDTLNMTYVTPSAAIDGGRTVTISRGILTVTKSNVVLAGNVSEATTDLNLGSWNFKVQGESITISTIKFDINVEGTVSSSDFTNLKLVKGGTSLTGATDGADGSTSSKDGAVTFSDAFTLPIGDNAITLVGTLSSDAANADTVQFGVDFTAASTNNLDATGDVTGDAIALSAVAATNYANPYGVEIDANLITITDLALSVTTLGSPAGSTVAAGTAAQTFSTIRFDASASSENVKVTAFEFQLTPAAGGYANQIQNITFTVNGTPLSITKSGTSAVLNTAEEITVSLSGADQFVIPKGTAVNMIIKGDISASASAAATFKMDITSTNSNVVTASGATSGNDIAVAEGTAVANNMTIGTSGGILEVSLASNNPDAALLAGGTTVSLANFKFYATSTEDVELDYLYLTQVSTDTASSSYLDYDEIWFVDEAGTEIVGTRMTPTSTTPYINFADNAFVVNYSDTNGEILTLKAKLATIGTGYNGASDHYIGYKINATADVVAKGDMTGNATAEYISTTAAPTGNTYYVYKSYPIFARVNLTGALSNGTKDLYKWTVTAVNNDLALYKFMFDIVTTTAIVTNFYVYDVTGTEVVLDDAATQAAGPSSTGMTITTIGTSWDGAYQTQDEVVVSSGTTRTFVLRGDVTLAAAGTSVSVRMAGDGAHVVGTTTLLHSATNVDADAEDDFIWSDMSASSHSDTTVDWTNGFLVSGLASPSTSAQVTAL